MCFGFRQYGGRSIAVEKEQRVKERIQDLKRSEYSYQKIADILKDDGVRTKSGQTIWYSKVVRQIWLRQSQFGT